MHFPRFTPKEDLNEYLKNPYNFRIYTSFRYIAKTEPEDGSFPSEIDMLSFFNLLYEQFEIVKAHKDKPLFIQAHLTDLQFEDEGTRHLFFEELSKLIRKAGGVNKYKSADPQLAICYHIIETIWLEKDSEYDNSNTSSIDAFTFVNLKKDLDEIPDLRDRIVYLIEQRAHYLNQTIYLSINPFAHSVTAREVIDSFKEQCQIELDRLQKLVALEEAHTVSAQESSVQKNHFKLTKSCSKIDLIRILNAMYELKLIEKADGYRPDKLEFMQQAGAFFGVDLSKYDTDLSQAFGSGKVEPNIKVFNEMIKVTKDKIKI